MKKKSKSKKKIIIPIVVIAAIVVVVLAVYFKKKKSYSDYSDGDITTYDDSGINLDGGSYFSAVIEPQESKYVDADSDREIDEIFVSQGDTVKAGDQLFSYKTKDVTLQIEQAKIEMEGYDATISDSNAQIKDLQNQKTQAVNEAKANGQPTTTVEYQYDSQVQDLNTSIKNAQLSKKKTQATIDDLNKKVSNSIVTSPIDGTISEINASTSSTTGSSGHLITILSSGAYQVKGTVDELNVGSLQAGMDVIIHSRVDQDKTWTGKITKVETDGASSSDSSQSSYMGGSTDGTAQGATKYTFYASLDTTDDLLLGQHVLVEVDYGDVTDMGADGSDGSDMTTDGTDGTDMTTDGADTSTDGADTTTDGADTTDGSNAADDSTSTDGAAADSTDNSEGN